MGGLGDVEHELKEPGWYPLPSDLLCFGSDAGGNPLMICLREDRYGEIFLIDHEMVSFEGEPEPIEEAEEYGLASRLALSFSQFVAGLHSE
jgi:hypothetical protein